MENAIYNWMLSWRKRPSTSFLAFMREEITRSHLRESTQKNHLSTLRLLAEYKPEIHFQDINYDFLCGFERFLAERRYHKNTIAKHMKQLKRYVNQAINMELFDISRYPFRKYRIKHQETKRTHLTPEELSRLETLDVEGRKGLRRCLDMFLFSCYTGLRFSDVVSIMRENFHRIDEKLWLIYSSVKTNVNVRLPLFLLFDAAPTSNSNLNKQLLRIARLAGFEKRISFHTARHTNATLLLYNGANITTVQKLLGHKSVRTTEIYSDIMDMTIVHDLEKIGKGTAR